MDEHVMIPFAQAKHGRVGGSVPLPFLRQLAWA